MAGNGGDIKLKVDLDINSAKKTANSLQSTISRALSSASPKLQNMGLQLEKAVDRANKFNSQLERMQNTRLPAQQFVDLQKELDSVDKEINKVRTDMQSMVQAGKHQTVSTEYTKLLEDEKWLLEQLEPLQKKHADYQSLGFTDKQLSTQEWYKEYVALSKELQDVRGEMEALRDMEQQYSKTSQYTEKEQQLATLSQRYDEIISKMAAMKQEGADTISQAEANPEKYAEVARQAGYANSAVDILSNKIRQAFSNTEALKRAWERFRSGVTTAVTKIAHAIKSKLNNALSHTQRSHNTSFKKMLNMVIKYGFGIRSIFLLYRKLRTTISSGLKELANQSSEVSNQMATLKSSWGGFKSSLVSAFQPIFSYVVPALTTLINYLTTAMNTLANFFSILTGQGWYYKATKGNESVAKSIGGTGSAAADATEKLADYDDLLVVDDNNSGGGGGGGSSSDWNWEKTEASPSKFAELLKEAFKTWDFTEVGEYIGQKLTDALNSINWDKVYQTAKNFGTGLATFLNGLISPDLFGALGTTVANAITTALLFLNTFGTTFDWKDFGHSIAEGIEKFVEHSPLKLAVNTFNVWAKGILDTLITTVRDLLDNGTINEISDDIAEAIGELDLGGITWKAGSLVSGLLNSLYVIVSNKDTWKNLGTKIGDGINGLFKSMNQVDPKTGLTGWGALAQDVSSLASGLLEMITKAVETIEWDEVGKAIADFISNIDWGRVIIDLGKLALAIASAIASALIGLVTNGDVTTNIGTAILTLIGAAKLLNLGSKLTTIISGALGSEFKSSIPTKLILGFVGLELLINSDEIGTAIGKKIAQAFGDDELVEYYDEYNTWGKIFERLKSDFTSYVLDLTSYTTVSLDAFKKGFDLWWKKYFTLTDDVERALDKYYKDLKTVFSNFANKVQNLAFEEKNGIKLQKNVNYEYDDKGGIRYAYKDNNENNEIVAKYKLDFEVLYNKGFISKKDLEQFTENIEKFKKYANKNGINIKNKFDMIGDIDSIEDFKKFIQMMNVVNDFSGVYESQYNIDVGGDVDTPSDVNKLGGSMNYLQGQWKNKDAKMTVTSSVDGQVGGGINALQNLGNSFKQKLYDIWKNRDANFGVTTSGVDGASKQYNGLKDIWKNQSANFSITSTGGPEARQQFNDTWYLFDKWGNKSANFEIGLNVSAGTVKNIANDVISKLNKQLDASGFFKNFNASPIPNIAAKGGIATTATFGIWGEAGTEALVPLENNLGWLSKMSSMITDELITSNRLPDITKGQVLPASSDFIRATANESGPSIQELLSLSDSNKAPIVLELNGRQIAQVVWDESAKRYKQTGVSYGF